MDILGRSPIPLPLLILGKLAFAGCWLFFIVKFLALDTMLYDSAVTRAIGIALFVCGGALALLALVHQGTRMTRKKWIHADKEESSRFKGRKGTTHFYRLNLLSAWAVDPDLIASLLKRVADVVDIGLITHHPDGHHVEPAGVLGNIMLEQIGLGETADFALFCGSDRRLWRAVLVVPTHLDLTEDKGIAIHGDNIDLTHLAVPVVRLKDAHPELLKPANGDLLAELALGMCVSWRH